MDFFMRFCTKPINTATATGLATAFCLFLLVACEQQVLNYGFSISDVSVQRAYQSLQIHLQQKLVLSQQAREALEHGVTLTIALQLELRNDDHMIVAKRDTRQFVIRYLPLSERYQLEVKGSSQLQTFPRLRHLLARLDQLNLVMPTGPLPEGGYQLRTRVSLDESLLPAPMQLPAWFSSQWQHDSEWSVWPFNVSA